MENATEVCRQRLSSIFDELTADDLEKVKVYLRGQGIPWGPVNSLNLSSEFANILLSHTGSVDECKERVLAILKAIPRYDVISQNDDFFVCLREKEEVKKQKCGRDQSEILVASQSKSRGRDSQLKEINQQVGELQKKIDELTLTCNSLSNKMAAIQDGDHKISSCQGDTSLDRLDAIQHKQILLETMVSAYKEMVDMLKSQISFDSKTIHRLVEDVQKARERFDTLESKFGDQERNLARNDQVLSEQVFRVNCLETTSYNCVLVWKITDFAKKQRDAISGRITSLYSPCFYTSSHGYKMCARIFLNGDGMGKGTHVSLFFVVMRGQYDELLKWPFGYKVSMTWVDQSHDHQRNVTHSFRPNPSSDSFQRPIADLNTPTGIPLFMPLSCISDPRHSYVKDDVAFVKITVDTNKFKNSFLFRVVDFSSEHVSPPEEYILVTTKSATHQ